MDNLLHPSGISYRVLGKTVRDIWVQWARSQGNPNPKHLETWAEIQVTQPEQVEVDILIGKSIADLVWQQISNISS